VGVLKLALPWIWWIPSPTVHEDKVAARLFAAICSCDVFSTSQSLSRNGLISFSIILTLSISHCLIFLLFFFSVFSFSYFPSTDKSLIHTSPFFLPFFKNRKLKKSTPSSSASHWCGNETLLDLTFWYLNRLVCGGSIFLPPKKKGLGAGCIHSGVRGLPGPTWATFLFSFLGFVTFIQGQCGMFFFFSFFFFELL
jgi:hypothetical protein